MASLFEEVLSVCVDAARTAGQVVRDVQKGREAGKALDAQLKDESDSRTYLTVADQRAQKVITSALRGAFPGITLVGEEDEEEVDAEVKEWQDANPQYFAPTYKRDLCRDLFTGKAGVPAVIADDDCSDYSWATLEDLCIFIDPIDGTREFVRGNVGACHTLIGVSLRGRARAGVMSLIFHNELGTVPDVASSAEGFVIYGARGVGAVGVPETLPQHEKVVLSTSSKADDPALIAALEVIDAGTTEPSGGCANKVLQLLSGAADVVLLNRANSLWDTCATEAILASQGGVLTTLHGNAIEHVHTSVSSITSNRFGAICSTRNYANVPNASNTKRTHKELCKALRERDEINVLFGELGARTDVLQAADVIRDITGHYYNCDDFSKMFCGEAGWVSQYSSPEADAVRYKQSYACRIHLTPNPDKEGSAEKVPKSVFFKRVVLRDMPYAASKARNYPFKIARDIKSCLVESRFLSSPCLTEYSESSGVAVAVPRSVEHQVFEHHAIDSRFGCILNDFTKEDGWEQCAHLGDAQIRATMRGIAFFHAYFWQGKRNGSTPQVVKDLIPSLWAAGTYWDVACQPKDQIESLERKWEKFRTTFADHLQPSERDDTTLGSRLAKVATEINTHNHGVDAEGFPIEGDATAEFNDYKTVIHGDTKAANFFFRGESEVGVIDFQWTGLGLGTTDVAYCLAASLHPDILTVGGEEDLGYLKHYHACLTEAFVKYGVAADQSAAEALYPYPLLQRHYERSVLDLARTIIGDHWFSVSPDILDKRHMAMGFNAYNKSTKVTVWLAARIKQYLDRY